MSAEQSTQRTGAAVKRRGLIAGAAALVVAMAAKQTAQPVAASTAMLIANTEAAGVTNTTVGKSIVLGAGATSDAVLVGDSGIGSALAGVMGTTLAEYTPTEFCAVYGRSNAAHAVFGNAASGIGIKGNSGSTIGVQGQCDAATGIGVIGASDAGTGVKGAAITGFPIVGQVVGPMSINAGVLGVGTAGPGVQGQSTDGHGLVGTTAATDGVHAALIGSVQPGSNAIGVRGSVQQGAVGYAGLFDGDVIINGALRVFGSPKNAAVKHPGDGTYRLLYCEEAAESWFADYGRGKLVGGKAEITLDVDFAALVHAEDYYVFLTAEGPQQLYVSQRTPTSFTVQALAADAAASGPKRPETAGGTFAWRVVAKRKDIAGERLAKVAAPPPLKPVTPFAAPKTPAAKPPMLSTGATGRRSDAP